MIHVLKQWVVFAVVPFMNTDQASTYNIRTATKPENWIAVGMVYCKHV